MEELDVGAVYWAANDDVKRKLVELGGTVADDLGSGGSKLVLVGEDFEVARINARLGGWESVLWAVDEAVGSDPARGGAFVSLSASDRVAVLEAGGRGAESLLGLMVEVEALRCGRWDSAYDRVAGWVKGSRELSKAAKYRLGVALKERARDFARWFDRWLRAEGWTASPRAGVWSRGGVAVGRAALEDALTLANARRTPKATPVELRAALEQWDREQAERETSTLRSGLAYDNARVAEGEALLRDAVERITGVDDEVSWRVVAHWIWWVKRRAHGVFGDDRHYQRPVMLILASTATGSANQNQGKTRWVQWLTRPVAGYRHEVGDLAAAFGDSDFGRLQQEKLVMAVDEMAGASRADVERLKNVLTAVEGNYRKLYTQSRESGPVTCSWVGTANRRVAELFYDPSGMTRFYELEVPGRVDMGWTFEVDASVIWESIDHTGPSPIVPVLDEVGARQERLRAKGPVEEWAGECVVDEDGWTGARELYGAFRLWAESTGARVSSEKAFSMELERLGYQRRQNPDRTSRRAEFRMVVESVGSVPAGFGRPMLRLV